MYEVLLIIGIIFGILQIILFFKIWGMTNNVAELNRNVKELLYRKEEEAKAPVDGLKVGDLVVELRTEQQMKISRITEDGKYECTAAGGIRPVGIFDKNDIELFAKYFKK